AYASGSYWKKKIKVSVLRCRFTPIADSGFENERCAIAPDLQANRLAWGQVADHIDEMTFALHGDIVQGENDVRRAQAGDVGGAAGIDPFDECPRYMGAPQAQGFTGIDHLGQLGPQVAALNAAALEQLHHDSFDHVARYAKADAGVAAAERG